VIEHHLRRVTNVTKNQFYFMMGRSTMEASFLLRQLIERYREHKDPRDLALDRTAWKSVKLVPEY
jgi:hypothetical protein